MASISPKGKLCVERIRNRWSDQDQWSIWYFIKYVEITIDWPLLAPGCSFIIYLKTSFNSCRI